MIFRSYKPSLLLDSFIEVIHLRHFIIPPHVIAPFKPYPPRPEHCLAFYVKGFETTEYPFENKREKRARSTLSGQFLQQINRHVSQEFLMIMVVFKPGALYRFTGIPFREFTNTAIDAEAVFGKEITSLNERLNSVDAYHEMIAFVNEFLVKQLNKIRKILLPVDEAIEWLLNHPNPLSVQQLSYYSCLSGRQLERTFLERIGVPPKTFLKIARFNKSYNLHLRKPNVSWSAIATVCGYTDYQHLVKDYRAFTGSTAAKFFETEDNAPERLLGLAR